MCVLRGASLSMVVLRRKQAAPLDQAQGEVAWPERGLKTLQDKWQNAKVGGSEYATSGAIYFYFV